MERTSCRALLGGVFIAAALAVLSAQPGIVVRVQPASIDAGQMATALVTAAAGTTVFVRTDAPGVPPQTIVGTGAEQSVRLGPFVRTGAYQVTASAGAQNSAASLRVAFPRDTAAPAPPTGSSTAYATAADALMDAADRARTGVSRLPQGERTVAETKAALDDLQRQLADIRRTATDTGDVFDAVRQQLEKDERATREAKDEFTRLEREINQNLAEQARQVRDLALDAERPAPDSCASAMAVTAALQAARSTMNAMRNGVVDLEAGQSRREAGASPVNAAAWRQIKAKIEDLVRTGQAGSYAEAESSIGRATGTGGLGGYGAQQCDKFSGEWSGTTYVEALEKGQPFYGLQNDWTARVEIAVARASEGATHRVPDDGAGPRTAGQRHVCRSSRGVCPRQSDDTEDQARRGRLRRPADRQDRGSRHPDGVAGAAGAGLRRCFPERKLAARAHGRAERHA